MIGIVICTLILLTLVVLLYKQITGQSFSSKPKVPNAADVILNVTGLIIVLWIDLAFLLYFVFKTFGISSPCM